MFDAFKQSFIEEAQDLLLSLESLLLELEENPSDSEAIAAVFRVMHTIKGSAAMFGFQHISSFTHQIENFMDQVRSGAVKINKDIIDLTLVARDHIKFLLDKTDPVDSEAQNTSAAILSRFQNKLKLPDEINKASTGSQASKQNSASAEQSANRGPPKQAGESPGAEANYRIRFSPSADIMNNGTLPLRLIGELFALGNCRIVPLVHQLPDLELIDLAKCFLKWDIFLTTRFDRNAIADIFIFAADQSELEITLLASPDEQVDEPLLFGQILVSHGSVSSQLIEQSVSQQKRLGILLSEHGVPDEEIKSALTEQEHIKASREKHQKEVSASSIRVSSEKLDTLVDLVGELVTLQARLGQTSQDLNSATLSNINESLERLSSELRENTMSIRMLPMSSTFSKFKRLVRDLSGDLGKNVELLTQGGETELDKTVLEKLNDPLIHLIRNCVDHGLESPSERALHAKPEQASIWLKAFHAGAMVKIVVEDDGRGLDLELIRQKGVERGLLSSQARPSRDELFDLIFSPGFSTAKQITSVSGRGVGLDVVKREIGNLGGLLHVDSVQGKGTTITLDIPLTLAIIEGLLVRCAREFYVIPLATVEECIELIKTESIVEHKQTIEYRNALLPLVDLRKKFAIDSQFEAIRQIVVIGIHEKKIGLVVDAVIGDHQTVIKNLGRFYRDADGISGATILGDGSLALILDVNSLIQSHTQSKKIGV